MIVGEKDFANSIEIGAVFYFKTAEVSSNVPHYFVVINTDIYSSPILVLPVATSQIEKRKRYYELQNQFLDKGSLVFVSSEESNYILEKESVFDCNQVKTKTINDLYSKYVNNELDYVGVLPENIVLKLRNGVKLAREISTWIKDLV